MLQLPRQEGKKGSKKALDLTQEGVDAFQAMKKALAKKLELYQVQPEQAFVLRTDASRYAIGAVLEQEVDGKWMPVPFFSQTSDGTQRNWSPREQETYAVVSALRKWAGWIGYTRVVVRTDHKAHGKLGHRTCGYPLWTSWEAG